MTSSGAGSAHADRGRGHREVHARPLRRAEALLARRQRGPDPDARRADPARRRDGAKEASSAWPTAAASTCSPTSSASRRRRSSMSSRATPPQPGSGRSFSGDVKYHKGFSNDVDTPGGLVHITLGFNPSHLEIISPVVHGSVSARQQRRGDRTGDQVLPVILHGDAAFAGQGVNMEVFNMSPGAQLWRRRHRAHRHQQPDRLHHQQRAGQPLDAYCTDVAKMVQAPIFHVNGDDPEAVDLRHPPRARLPQPVPEGRGHRPGLLPPSRPQRGRRTGGDSTDDVPEDPQSSAGPGRIRRPPDRRPADDTGETPDYVEEYPRRVRTRHCVGRPSACGLERPAPRRLERVPRHPLGSRR
jgi:hypothetical protein